MYAVVILALASSPDVAAAGLGSTDWRTREKATALLAAAGRSARPALLKAVSSDDPEVRDRASVLLTALHNQRVNSFRPFPPIDGMWYCDKKYHYATADTETGECAENYRKYGKYLKAAQGLSSADGDYPSYRRATRMMVEEWMYEGRDDEFIREQLAEIARRDLVWRKKNNINNINGTNVVVPTAATAPTEVP